MLTILSDLLDGDSEMRNAMDDLESTEEESGPSRKPGTKYFVLFVPLGLISFGTASTFPPQSSQWGQRP